MTSRLSTTLLAVSMVVLAFAMLVRTAQEAHPGESDPALPGTSDTRAWWQSRLDLLHEGMPFAEVRALLPPWGGTEAAHGGGGAVHYGWVVSPHWQVQVAFSDRGTCLGGGRLLALGLPNEARRPERIARLVRRRPYEVASVAFEAEDDSVDRPTAFHVEAEIEVYADGRYRWTQVSHTEADDAVQEGTLPEPLTADLAGALGVGSTPLHVDETEAGPRESLPAAVTAVLAHLESGQPGQQPEKR